LLTAQQELEGAEVDELADMACPTFAGHQLDDAPQHSHNVNLWITTKKLPAHTPVAGAIPADAERTMAEIAYFASTLRDAATLWFHGLNVNTAPAAEFISMLNALIAAFELQFAFDPAQKWD